MIEKILDFVLNMSYEESNNLNRLARVVERQQSHFREIGEMTRILSNTQHLGAYESIFRTIKVHKIDRHSCWEKYHLSIGFPALVIQKVLDEVFPKLKHANILVAAFADSQVDMKFDGSTTEVIYSCGDLSVEVQRLGEMSSDYGSVSPPQLGYEVEKEEGPSCPTWLTMELQKLQVLDSFPIFSMIPHLNQLLPDCFNEYSDLIPNFDWPWEGWNDKRYWFEIQKHGKLGALMKILGLSIKLKFQSFFDGELGSSENEEFEADETLKQWVELNEIVNAITDKEWISIFKMARDCQARPKAHLRDIWMNKLDPTNEFFRRQRKRKREEI